MYVYVVVVVVVTSMQYMDFIFYYARTVCEWVPNLQWKSLIDLSLRLFVLLWPSFVLRERTVDRAFQKEKTEMEDGSKKEEDGKQETTQTHHQ